MTAPKFLGYSFNPVSFWYLYDEDKTLKAMILEVNNTFDERRMYLLKQDALVKETSAARDDLDSKPDRKPTPTSANFTDTWSKDFHVSPFNSRKGSYSLKAYDPFFPQFIRNPTIDNTITLSSSKDHPKLIAKIASTGPAVDPAHLGHWDTFRFIMSWWWVGFVTFPRIVREAGKLFFKRKLKVWYRPEVVGTSIGRTATYYER